MTEKSKFKRNGLESEITESENYLFCICSGGRTVFTLGCYCRYILKSHLEKKPIWSLLQFMAVALDIRQSVTFLLRLKLTNYSNISLVASCFNQ